MTACIVGDGHRIRFVVLATADSEALPDPFATESIEDLKPGKEDRAPIHDTRMPEEEAPKFQQESVREVKQETLKHEVTPEPALPDDDDEDNEKTQIAPTLGPVVQNQANPFDALWEDFCRIKRKHGETVSDKEKTAFIGKVRTNKASIMAKYKCSDVQFSVEDKDGKPVIKAKPIN